MGAHGVSFGSVHLTHTRDSMKQPATKVVFCRLYADAVRRHWFLAPATSRRPTCGPAKENRAVIRAVGLESGRKQILSRRRRRESVRRTGLPVLAGFKARLNEIATKRRLVCSEAPTRMA